MNHIDCETEKAIRCFLSLMDKRYDIVGAILYGSRARGTHDPDSDADVAVILKGEHRRTLPTALEMADVAYEVLLETGINISPLPVWIDEWEHPERHSNPTLLKNIFEEGIILAMESKRPRLLTQSEIESLRQGMKRDSDWAMNELKRREEEKNKTKK